MVTLKLIAVLVSLLVPNAAPVIFVYNVKTFTDAAECEATGKDQKPAIAEQLRERSGLVEGVDYTIEMKCVLSDAKDA